jgi:hypothetical protein
MHRIDHVVQDVIEDLAGIFGVAIGHELHRSPDVGEEDGDELALPFDGAP